MKRRPPLPYLFALSAVAVGGLGGSAVVAAPAWAVDGTGGPSTVSAGSSGVAEQGAAVVSVAAVRAAVEDQAIPPGVVTAPPHAVGAGTAELAGAVVAGDAEATYSFEYGSTPGYGIGTAPQTIPAGTEPTVVRADVAELGVDSTWHYRLVARSSSGITYGADQTFTTSAPARPPAVLGLPAEGVTSSKATLRARVDPAGRATQVSFQYGTTPAFGSQTPAVAVGADAVFGPVDVPVAGLAPNTPYFVRAVATNDAGTTYGFTVPLVTASAPTAITAESSLRTVTWATGATIVGKVAGAGVEGSILRLMKQGFPFGAPVVVGTTKVEAGGTYGFDTGQQFATTRFWIEAESAPSVRSPAMTTYGKYRVRLLEPKLTSTRGTLSGTVSPSVEGTTATLQRRFGSERWKAVDEVELDRASPAKSTFTAPVTRTSYMAKYRLLVEPKTKGALYATASNVKGVKGR